MEGSMTKTKEAIQDILRFDIWVFWGWIFGYFKNISIKCECVNIPLAPLPLQRASVRGGKWLPSRIPEIQSGGLWTFLKYVNTKVWGPSEVLNPDILLTLCSLLFSWSMHCWWCRTKMMIWIFVENVLVELKFVVKWGERAKVEELWVNQWRRRIIFAADSIISHIWIFGIFDI